MTQLVNAKQPLSIVLTVSMLLQQLFMGMGANGTVFAQDGPVVVGGTAAIVANGTTLDITSQSDRTIINWNSFNIPQGHTTNFHQPGANSAVLNRVITPNNPSAIFGTLNSNGNVFLVNPSGIIVGPSGVINTNGFTASVLDIPNNEFLQGGVLNFRGDSRASIINQGSISTGTGGTTLIGGEVINEGLIESNGGSINLLTGGSVNLRGGGVYTQADQATLLNGISETSGLIKNDGTLRATGALEVGGEVYLVSPGGTVIEQAIVEARQKDSQGNSHGGNVVVDAGSGTATVTGKIDVQGQTGGTVTVTGNEVNLQGADINASGVHGGGNINIGGGFQGNDPDIHNSQFTLVDSDTLLQANAEMSGDGGNVIIWSDGWTDYFGSITNTSSAIGHGGFTEVSGKNVLVFGGNVNTGGGILLLDPSNFSIEAGSVFGPNFVGVDLLLNTINNSGLTVFNTAGSGPENGNFTINADLIYNSSNNLALFAHGDMIFNASVQNSGSGNMTFVAGWDGTSSVVPLAQYINADPNSTTLYGNNNGSIYIGSGSQTNGISVGSAHGQTTVLGHDLILQGSTTGTAAHAQLGFRHISGGTIDSTITTGDIAVGLTGALQANGGAFGQTSTSNNPTSFVQIGHGGNRTSGSTAASSANRWNYTGDITLNVTEGITFQGGTGTATYAQLGHGGYYAYGSHSGTQTITSGGDISFSAGSFYAYTQLGHGGFNAAGSHSGATNITSAQNINFTAGSVYAYAQLGQGGRNADGNHSGTTTITTAQNITFTGGSVEAYAQLGQGGFDTSGNHSGTTTITSAQDITFNAGNNTSAYAQLGHGGFGATGSHDGTTTITAARDIRFTSGGYEAYSQLGHGGLDANGSHNGTITIGAARDISFTATSMGAYSQLGQGGYGAAGNHTGTITIAPSRDITFQAGTNSGSAYAQLGHGGLLAPGDHTGDISITSANDLTFNGGGGISSFVQLGHGGAYSGGDHLGTITITSANDLSFQAGNQFATYAQLGHGGYAATGSYDSAIDVTLNGDLTFTGANATNRYALFGHGDHPGDSDTSHNVSGNITLRVGQNAELTNTFIGHLIDATGTYTSGNTFLGVRGDLTTDASSQFFSAAPAQNGELRLYVAGQDLVNTDTLLNGTAHGGNPFPNNQGIFGLGTGPYTADPATNGNFAYYNQPDNIFNYNIDSSAAANILAALANGDLTLITSLDQPEFGAFFDWDGDTQYITVNSPIAASSPNSLNLVATGDITINSNLVWNTDSPLSLIAGQDIVINDGVIITHNSTDTFLLRADSQGTGNGTVTFNGVGVIQSTRGGRVEILYNPTDYTTPTDYSGNVTLSNNSSLFAGMLVNDVNDLQAINTNLYGHYALGRDIDAADTINWNGGAGFAPIGSNYSSSFRGIFDGRGHSISDLYINRGTTDNVGLFGVMDGTVQDVRLINANVTGEDYVGTLAGYNFNVVRRAHATGQVNANSGVGGLVGGQNLDLIELSSADVQVTGTGVYTGGLLGHNFGGTVLQSYATGFVSGNDQVGGLVGRSSGGTVTQSYSTGMVTGNFNFGGLVGVGFNANISNSFWNIETSGQLTSAGGTGLTTFQMQRQATFTDANWDFANVWHLQENASNPLFLNQALPAPSTKIALSGFVYDGWGSSTPVGVNQLVTVLVDGSVAGSAITGFNGEYGLLVDPLTSGNAVLTYRNGSPVTGGGHVWRTDGSSQPLDIFTGALVASASPGQQVDQSLFVDALGTHNDVDIPYSISSLILDPGISFVLNSGSHLVLDDDIITDGADILLNGTTSLSASAQLQSGRDLIVNGAITWDTSDTLTLLAEHNIYFKANVQNTHATIGTGGNLNVVAGWDGTTAFDLASFQAIDVNAAPTLFGNNDGSVFIGSATQATGVSVGSRHGKTNLFGHDLTLRGSDTNPAHAQLGFHDVTGQGLADGELITTGEVAVRLTGQLEALAGIRGSNASNQTSSYVQIGHGGNRRESFLLSNTWDYSGDISLAVNGDIDFTAGAGSSTYAQLGHGGFLANGNRSGNVSIQTARDIHFQGGTLSYGYAMLGHGGYQVIGDLTGHHTITQANDITFQGGSGDDTYAQMGNGGKDTLGNHSGNHQIASANTITFYGGGIRAYAQMGNGGIEASGDHSGNLSVNSFSDINLQAGPGARSYAQIGNGGYNAHGNHSGTINVVTSGDLLMSGTNPRNHYAAIGNGNTLGTTDNGTSAEGDVTVTVAGQATLTSALIGAHTRTNLNSGMINSGRTFIAIGTGNYAPDNTTSTLTMDDNSKLTSAAPAQSGELRIYLPNADSFLADDGATLNGVDVATFGTGLSNLEGRFNPFLGTYTPDQGIGNFAFYLSFIELIVNANSSSSTYGDTPINPGLDLFSGTLLNGDTLASIGLTNNFILTAGSDANVYTLTVDDSNLDANYKLVGSTSGTFTINKADLTITPTAQNKTYGDLFVFTGSEFTADGLKDNDVITSVALNSLGTPQAADAGLYNITSTVITGSTSFNADNYNIDFGTLDNGFTVNKADLCFTILPQTKTYGETFNFNGTEFTVDGLQNNQTIITLGLSSAATPADANAGNYDILISGITQSGNGFNADNYNFTLTDLDNGFTVNKADLTIMPTAQSKFVGETFVFEGTEFVVSGLKNDDQVLSVALTSPGADPMAIAGNYNIVGTAITDSLHFESNNYNITFETLVNGFTVQPLLAGDQVGNQVYDQFTRYEDYFRTLNSLFRPIGSGGINWIGPPTDTHELDDPEEGTIPIEIRLNGLQVSN